MPWLYHVEFSVLLLRLSFKAKNKQQQQQHNFHNSYDQNGGHTASSQRKISLYVFLFVHLFVFFEPKPKT